MIEAEGQCLPCAAKPNEHDVFWYDGCTPKPDPKDLTDAIDRAFVLQGVMISGFEVSFRSSGWKIATSEREVQLRSSGWKIATFKSGSSARSAAVGKPQL